jgi:hypothetical protein
VGRISIKEDDPRKAASLRKLQIVSPNYVLGHLEVSNRSASYSILL